LRTTTTSFLAVARNKEMMRIAVMGSGAVGGYFGARLAAAGQEVNFIARGNHLAALKRSGLYIESFQESLHVPSALFTDDPQAADTADLVLFCVKSYDTDTAARMIAPLVTPITRILSLQNGVDNPSRIARIWSSERTLGGIVYLGAQLVRPGIIRHSSGGRIIFGQLDGSIQEPTRNLQRLISAAKIPCEVSADIVKAQWRKLLWNAAFCAISCLTRGTVKEIIGSASLRKLAVDCMAEVIAAAKTQGVYLEPACIDETLEFSKTLGDFKPSMLQDLEAGKPLEFEAFNGVVLNCLRQSGTAAPVNEVFYGSLAYLDKKIRSVKRSTVEEI
jgi:2-dehydropantoate 2-reductase